jgi:predicted RNA-binding protein YlqC (UPF0109 family)
VLADGLIDHFDESPISQQLTMKDICIYKPGDLNKIGKEGKTMNALRVIFGRIAAVTGRKVYIQVSNSGQGGNRY